MTRLRLNRAVKQQRSDDSGAALITALLAILLTATFAIVMLGVLLSQMVPTELQQATTRTVFAAEAGINAAVGQLRNAAGPPDGEGKIYGKKELLPCTASGTVASGGSEAAYTVTLQYFTKDPTGRDETWRSANDLSCTAGNGPSEDPTHAVIKSSGTGIDVPRAPGDVDRTIEVIYAFKVTNNNIPGGYIYSWDKTITNDRFCLEATSPAVGANIKYVAAADCGTKDPRQLWVYDKDYRIKLASSTVPSFGGSPLCIEATPNGSTPVAATLQVCKAVTDASRWNQLWSWEGGASWRGQKSVISGGYSDYYLSSGSMNTPVIGSLLKVWDQAPKDSEWSSYNPDPRVGAGAAGKSTNQIVNYLEFGRCTDVTHGTVGESEMIVYPCKQDPNPSQTALNWNHKWYYNEPTNELGALGPQQIYVNNGTKHCLQSAGTQGGHVTFTSGCSTTNTAQKWTRTAWTGNYDTSYTFTDGYGRCLDLGPWYKVGTSNQEAWSTLVTKTCNGSLGQKWNAPPNAISAALGGYWELP